MRKEYLRLDLPKKSGKSYNSINEYAHNVRQPSIRDLYKTVEIFNINVKELLVEHE